MGKIVDDDYPIVITSRHSRDPIKTTDCEQKEFAIQLVCSLKSADALHGNKVDA